MGAVGRSLPRRDGRAKVEGSARYVADLSLPGMLHGRTIRSSIPRGEILAVRPRCDLREFTFVDHRDIPGRNAHRIFSDDQPILCDRRVAHLEEPIALLAHPDPEALSAAVVAVEYAREAPRLDPLGATEVFDEVIVERGDAARELAAADRVVAGEYRTGAQEHLYLEPNGVLAVPGDGGVTIHGSLQCPFYVRAALAVVLDLPPEKVRVIALPCGGGFGGKEEYPSMIAAHAALLALKADRPVRLLYDRREDMRATTKRHPSIVRHRTGLAADGRLLAMDIEVLLDGGAYRTLSPVVLSRAVLHATGAYRCEHVRIRGRVVRTNRPPSGAFRGFGAPQTLFALEVHMERIAEELDLGPFELRERNVLVPGDRLPTGQVLGGDTSALDVLREAERRSDFRRRRAALRGTRRALGMALYLHGAGFTGAGERRLASEVALELTPAGVRVRCASTEIGQGAHTVLAQVVADALDWPLQAVEVSEVDTADVPDSGPTVASRTSLIVGGLLAECARELARRLGGLAPSAYLDRYGPLVVRERYREPPEIHWDEQRYRGDAYGTYSWGCDVVELELDPDTFEITPLKLTAVCEIGKALNPNLARGQVEGGSAQGLGWALCEEVVERDGAMANATLSDYIIPTVVDTPAMDVVLLEKPYRRGPMGAKGLGELPLSGPAPAVVNALRALDIDLRAIPATPERILEATCDSP